jgi:hypothetical protein
VEASLGSRSGQWERTVGFSTDRISDERKGFLSHVARVEHALLEPREAAAEHVLGEPVRLRSSPRSCPWPVYVAVAGAVGLALFALLDVPLRARRAAV